MFKVFNLNLPEDCVQSEDFHELTSLIGSGKIIALDGFPGVGKTTLAKRLSDELDAIVLEIDHFRTKQTGSFILTEQDLDLIDGLVKKFSKSKRKLIIEGVLVYDLLMKKKIKTDYYVWVAEKENKNNAYQFIFESYKGVSISDQNLSEKELLDRFVELDPLINADIFYKQNTW